MKVILTKPVDALGTKGDVVDVSDGYARNYLIPKKFAVKAWCAPQWVLPRHAPDQRSDFRRDWRAASSPGT